MEEKLIKEHFALYKQLFSCKEMLKSGNEENNYILKVIIDYLIVDGAVVENLINKPNQ